MDLFCDAHQTTRAYQGYVSELRRLFVFHGLSCGAVESFGSLGAKLAESKAFRTDVSALARSIRDQEKGAISAEEMLTTFALASGGEELVEGRSPAVGILRTVGLLRVLLDAIGGWRETGTADSGATGPPGGPGAFRQAEPMPGTSFAGAEAGLGIPFSEAIATPPAEVRPAVDAVSEPTGILPTVGKGPKDGVELAIVEMKVYLDDMERRISRLEPHIEDLSMTVQESAERFARLEREKPKGVAAVEAGQEVPGAEHVEAGGWVPRMPPTSANGAGKRPVDNWRFGAGRPEAAPVASAREKEADRRHEPEVVYVGRVGGDAAWQPAQGRGAGGDHESLAGGLENFAGRDDTRVGTGWDVASLLRGAWEGVELKQRVGTALGALALLLVVAGTIGLVMIARSPRANEAAAQGSEDPRSSAAVPRPVTPLPTTIAELRPTPAPTSLPAGTVGSAPAPTSIAKSGAVARPARVAGKREEMIRPEPRIEEPRRAPEKVAAAVSAGKPDAPAKARVAEVPSAGAAAPSKEKAVVEVRSATGKVVSARRPVYPAEALRTGAEATVVLNAFVAKDGTVKRMDVVKGSYGFNRSAMDAVWSWRYKPEMVNGKPVEAETEITIDYRLH